MGRCSETHLRVAGWFWESRKVPKQGVGWGGVVCLPASSSPHCVTDGSQLKSAKLLISGCLWDGT